MCSLIVIVCSCCVCVCGDDAMEKHSLRNENIEMKLSDESNCNSLNWCKLTFYEIDWMRLIFFGRSIVSRCDWKWKSKWFSMRNEECSWMCNWCWQHCLSFSTLGGVFLILISRLVLSGRFNSSGSCNFEIRQEFVLNPFRLWTVADDASHALTDSAFFIK